jgi:hypothetical protein
VVAIAAVTAAAVAVVIPLVLSGTGGRTAPAAPLRQVHPNRALAQSGAPTAYWTIRGGSVTNVSPHGRDGIRPSGLGGALALGVSADARTAYGAFPVSGCRTEIDRDRLTAPHHIVTSDVVTIEGRAVSAPMAISPDGRFLALAVSRSCPEGDQGDDDLVVVGLGRHHTVERWANEGRLRIHGLHWAPDSRRLAFIYMWCCKASNNGGGISVLDTAKPNRGLSAAVASLPSIDVSTGGAYGPEFWWHGQQATFLSGRLRAVGSGEAGKALATGFPATVDAVSSDPTGNHLIVHSPGPDGGTTYRWDNGLLTRLPGHPTQAGW